MENETDSDCDDDAVVPQVVHGVHDMRVANGASNMTTTVALEQNIFRDFLGISGVGVRM